MSEKKKESVLIIDPKEIKEGSCIIQSSGEQLFSICREDDKIKIFPVEQSRERVRKNAL
jgi:hypothetical protein